MKGNVFGDAGSNRVTSSITAQAQAMLMKTIQSSTLIHPATVTQGSKRTYVKDLYAN